MNNGWIETNRNKVTKLAGEFRDLVSAAEAAKAGRHDPDRFPPDPERYATACADHHRLRYSIMCQIIGNQAQYVHIHTAIIGDIAFNAAMREASSAQVARYLRLQEAYADMARQAARQAAFYEPASTPASALEGTAISDARNVQDPRLQTATDIQALVIALSQEEVAMHLAICGLLCSELRLHLGQSAHLGRISEVQESAMGLIGGLYDTHFTTAGHRTAGVRALLEGRHGPQ